MVKARYAIVLTRSPDIADNTFILARQIEPCLHKQGTFGLQQELLKTLGKSVKASFSYSSWTRRSHKDKDPQDSADLSSWKLGLDTPLAF